MDTGAPINGGASVRTFYRNDLGFERCGRCKNDWEIIRDEDGEVNMKTAKCPYCESRLCEDCDKKHECVEVQ